MKIPNFFRKIKKNQYKYLEFIPNFKKERTQEFATIVFTIVALSFFSILAINPTLGTIAKLKKELKDNMFVEEQLRKKINNLSLLQQNYSQIRPDLEIIQQTIPKTAEAPILLAQIQALALEDNIVLSGLQVFQVEVAQNDSRRGYSSFSFSLSGEGSYDDLYKFISDLSKMQRIVSFEILTLTRRGEGENLYLINLRGMAYFKR
ncbi:MAG: type 4a pilus biogenesis protein PilO [Candidatus Levybacteria bacterium]|nr:type 4a pilus biogenesis protein PilO [Candidatus Levybacteria bacterium]